LGDEKTNDSNATITDHRCNITTVGCVPIAARQGVRFKRLVYVVQRTLACRIPYSTAIYWHSLMFVILSSSTDTIDQVRAINLEYAKDHPVQILL